MVTGLSWFSGQPGTPTGSPPPTSAETSPTTSPPQSRGCPTSTSTTSRTQLHGCSPTEPKSSPAPSPTYPCEDVRAESRAGLTPSPSRDLLLATSESRPGRRGKRRRDAPAFARVGYPFASGSPGEDAGKSATVRRGDSRSARSDRCTGRQGRRPRSGNGSPRPETSATTEGRTIRRLS